MHNHSGAVIDADAPEKQQALLDYMVNHNKSHAEELHELAHVLKGEPADLVHEAVDLLNQSNDKLASALQKLKEAQ